MMADYAIIKDGVVKNVIVWDGKGDLFSEYSTYEIKKGQQVGPGFSAEQNSSGHWEFKAPVIVITPEEQAALNLQLAQSEYVRASAKITALNERIEDEDYSGTTEAAVKAELTLWTTYRKALRAYSSAADGDAAFPSAPDA